TLRSFDSLEVFFEMNNFSRAIGAFLLAMSLLGSSTISLAQQTTTTKTTDQTAKPTQTQQTDTKSTDSDEPPKMTRSAPKADDATKPADTTKQADTAKQQVPDPKKAAQTTAVNTTPRSTKPLSTNEDPAMIGKRNINGGFIGKIAGS